MRSAIEWKQILSLYKLLAELTNLYSPTDRSSFELPSVWFWVKEKAYGVHLFHTPVTVISCFTVVQKSKNRECHRSVCLLYFYSLYFRLLLSFFRQRDFQKCRLYTPLQLCFHLYLKYQRFCNMSHSFFLCGYILRFYSFHRFLTYALHTG